MAWQWREVNIVVQLLHYCSCCNIFGFGIRRILALILALTLALTLALILALQWREVDMVIHLLRYCSCCNIAILRRGRNSIPRYNPSL